MAVVLTDHGLIIAGIDPGISGALAILNEGGDCETVAMPIMGDPHVVDGGAVVRWLGDHDAQLAVIEMAQAMPKQGVTGMFRYGQAFGTVLGALQAALIPYRMVSSAKWKREMGLSKDKELSRKRAIELLPHTAARGQFSLKKDEARAEAALIAWWYLNERNNHKQVKEGTEVFKDTH